MSDKIPLLKAKDVAKVLEKLGFQFKRQKGSHMFFEHPDEDIDIGLLNKIIKQDLQISREEFLKHLK
ncbi:MAG: type II toxin-antitoxin system HicA family toxin [bacterium]|nr:type II toxin-antitoxin system HicA family toxin [bacterium]